MHFDHGALGLSLLHSATCRGTHGVVDPETTSAHRTRSLFPREARGVGLAPPFPVRCTQTDRLGREAVSSSRCWLAGLFFFVCRDDILRSKTQTCFVWNNHMHLHMYNMWELHAASLALFVVSHAITAYDISESFAAQERYLTLVHCNSVRLPVPAPDRPTERGWRLNSNEPTL